MQGRRFADDIFQPVTLIHLLPQRAIFLLQLPGAERARDQHFDLVEIERLGHKIVGAALHRFDRGIDRTVRRHHDADRRMRQFQRAIDQRHPVLAREPQIGDQHIDRLALEHIHRAADVFRDVGVVFILEQTPQSIARMLFIIDNEDGGLRRHLAN